MNRNRWMGITISLLVLLNVVLVILLWTFIRGVRVPPGGDRNAPPERLETVLKNELGFSDQQVDAFLQSRRAHLEKSRRIAEAIQPLKGELFREAMAASPDTTLIQALIDSIGDRQKQLELLMVEYFGELKQLCKPGQEQRLHRILRDYFPPPANRPPGDRRPGNHQPLPEPPIR